MPTRNGATTDEKDNAAAVTYESEVGIDAVHLSFGGGEGYATMIEYTLSPYKTVCIDTKCGEKAAKHGEHTGAVMVDTVVGEYAYMYNRVSLDDSKDIDVNDAVLVVLDAAVFVVVFKLMCMPCGHCRVDG